MSAPSRDDVQIAEDLIGTLMATTKVLTTAIDSSNGPYLFEAAVICLKQAQWEAESVREALVRARRGQPS